MMAMDILLAKKGNEIPLGSRIISIADAYDSMISNRAYRQGLSSDAALKLIEEKSRNPV